ncbi:MAG: Hsp20/alpha crystallin family protein [Firmicutes bacterium]|nr:Hsp20/alpha crystallin family protein [Bacillota bacterium]
MNLIPKRYDLDDIFDNFLSVPTESNMKCDIYEKDGKYHIEMDVPGFSKNDINIECSKGYLTITTEKNEETSDSGDSKKYVRRERTYGKYQREFYLGSIETDKIEAELNNGTLYITVPKKNDLGESKTIEIK